MNESHLDEKLNSDQKLEEIIIGLDWYKFQQRIQPLPWTPFLDFSQILVPQLNQGKKVKYIKY